jgi:hypothetical protein
MPTKVKDWKCLKEYHQLGLIARQLQRMRDFVPKCNPVSKVIIFTARTWEQETGSILVS